MGKDIFDAAVNKKYLARTENYLAAKKAAEKAEIKNNANPHFISVKEVTKNISNYKLENVSFDVGAGLITGVIGRNGAGKTTLLRMLLGSYKFGSEDKGDMSIDGISIRDNAAGYKENIAFVLNDSPFDLGRKALENGRLYGKYYKTFDFKKYESLLKSFRVPLASPVIRMSKGEHIKQQLAFALSYEAKVYIFDEPAGNLDVAFRDTFYTYVREITKDGTKSVIYASHLIEELEEMADYLLWLEDKDGNGSVKYFGTADDLKENYRIVEAGGEIQEMFNENDIVGFRKSENHNEVMIRYKTDRLPAEVKKYCRYADLKEIMYYVEKENKQH